MYVIKKCTDYTYGKNKWGVIHSTPDCEAAISFVREEYRLLLSSDPNLSSEEIDRRMNAGFLPKTGQPLYGRREFAHNGIAFSIMQSDSVEYQPVERPSAREALDKIIV